MNIPTNAYLTNNAQVTYMKKIYRRHTPFYCSTSKLSPNEDIIENENGSHNHSFCLNHHESASFIQRLTIVFKDPSFSFKTHIESMNLKITNPENIQKPIIFNETINGLEMEHNPYSKTQGDNTVCNLPFFFFINGNRLPIHSVLSHCPTACINLFITSAPDLTFDLFADYVFLGIDEHNRFGLMSSEMLSDLRQLQLSSNTFETKIENEYKPKKQKYFQSNYIKNDIIYYGPLFKNRLYELFLIMKRLNTAADINIRMMIASYLAEIEGFTTNTFKLTTPIEWNGTTSVIVFYLEDSNGNEIHNNGLLTAYVDCKNTDGSLFKVRQYGSLMNIVKGRHVWKFFLETDSASYYQIQSKNYEFNSSQTSGHIIIYPGDDLHVVCDSRVSKIIAFPYGTASFLVNGEDDIGVLYG
jgi:hypothetical protein